MTIFRIDHARDEIQQPTGNIPLGFGQIQNHKFHVPEKVCNLRCIFILLRGHKDDLHICYTVNRLDPFILPTLIVLLVGIIGFVFIVQVVFFRLPAQRAKE